MATLSALSLPSFCCGLLVLMFAVHVYGTIPIHSDDPRGLWHELALLSTFAVVIANFIVDMLYAVTDPRIKYSD